MLDGQSSTLPRVLRYLIGCTTTVPLAPKIYVKLLKTLKSYEEGALNLQNVRGLCMMMNKRFKDDIQSCFREFLSVKNLLLSEISLSSSDDVLQNYVDFETVLEKANDMSTLSKRLGHGRRV